MDRWITPDRKNFNLSGNTIFKLLALASRMGMQGIEMTGLRRELPRRAWRRIYRVSGAVTAISIAFSVILTNVIMETFSAGINIPGLAVSIVTPMILGGPLVFILVLKHEQLRHANSQLEQLAGTDWLTSLLNRRAFTAAVTEHLASLRKRKLATGALLIIDADDFKSVNDRFGHHNGDEAICLIATAIRQSVGSAGVVGRLGGEEFGVLLTHADATTADTIAQTIRLAVVSMAFRPNDRPCSLSVSIGGATCAPETDFADLYRLADNHLYDAKKTGRDRVSMMQAA